MIQTILNLFDNTIQSYIKNNDLKIKIEKIYSKYEPLKEILQNNELSLQEKQEKIEKDCIFNFIINDNDYIYNLGNIFYKDIIHDLYSHKHIKTKDHLVNIIHYIEHIDLIIINSLNNSFIKNEYEPTLGLTNVSLNIFEDLKKHCILKESIEQIENDITPNSKQIINSFDEKTSDVLKLIYISLELLEKNNILQIQLINEEKKKKKYIILTDHFISNTYNCKVNITNLPMIVEPNDWNIHNNKITHYGGYLWNYKYKNIQLIHFNRERSQQTCLKQPFLDIINKLQKQVYQIDKNELNKYYPFENIINKINKVDSENIYCSLETILNFESKEEIYLRYRSSLENDKDYNFFSKNYNKMIYNLAILVETLYLAELYKDYKIYFPIYNDFRNRLYYHSYPLNIQSSKLTKSLIKINDIPNNELVSLDATASGLQIISTILKNEKILNLTNLLNDNDEDIYEYYRNKFNSHEINHLPESMLNRSGWKVIIRKEKFEFEERKLFKKLLMTYTYNKETFGMSKDIENLDIYIGDEIYEHNSERIKMNQGEKYYHMKNLYIFFQQEFKDIERFKLFINTIIDKTENNTIKLNQNSNFISTQFYAKQEKKIIRFTIEKKKLSMTISKDIIPRKMNKRKAKKGTMPNFIHNIDSHILFQMIKKCHEHNIPIFTIHDCFVVPKENERIVKEFYLYIMNNLIRGNVLEQFLNNNIENEDLRKEIYNEFKDLFKEKDIILNNLNGLKKESLEYEFKL